MPCESSFCSEFGVSASNAFGLVCVTGLLCPTIFDLARPFAQILTAFDFVHEFAYPAPFPVLIKPVGSHYVYGVQFLDSS